MPAGCQRSDKRERHGTPPSLVASGYVQQEEKIKTAGKMPAILKYNFLYNGLNRLSPELLWNAELQFGSFLVYH
jgi:hypothetical protein